MVGNHNMIPTFKQELATCTSVIPVWVYDDWTYFNPGPNQRFYTPGWTKRNPQLAFQDFSLSGMTPAVCWLAQRNLRGLVGRSCCDKHGDHMATRHSPPTLPKQSGKASRIQTQSTLVRVLANVGYVGWCLNTRGYETDTGKTSFHVHESMPSRMLLFRCMLWLLWLLNRRCWTGSDQAVPVTLRSTSILQADFSSKPTRTP